MSQDLSPTEPHKRRHDMMRSIFPLYSLFLAAELSYKSKVVYLNWRDFFGGRMVLQCLPGGKSGFIMVSVHCTGAYMCVCVCSFDTHTKKRSYTLLDFISFKTLQAVT